LLRFDSPLRKWVPTIVLVIGLLVTTLATYYVAQSIDARERLRFQNSVQRVEDATKSRLETYIALLRAGSGLFAAGETVERDEFQSFIERLDVSTYYPGVQGIGYTIRLAPEEVQPLIAAVRAQGIETFDVWPPGEREEYHSIIYLEPLDDRNRAALGFDMFQEPVRNAAMTRARDTGQPAASGRVTLVQEIDEHVQAGFLIYFPVYRDGTVPITVAERRALLEGFVYSPFRADDLLMGIFGNESFPTLDLHVYDGPQPDPESLLHASDPVGNARAAPRYITTRSIQVAGRPWTLAFSTRPEFDYGRNREFIPLTLVAGLLTTFALYTITRAQARARAAAEQSAADFRLLAGAGTALTASLDYETTLNRVAQLAIPHLGDWFAIHVLEKGRDTRLIASAHSDPGKAEVVADLRELYPMTPEQSEHHPLFRVLRTGEPELIPDATPDMLVSVAQNEKHLEMLRALGLRSLIIAPLVAREQVIGAITLAIMGSARRYSPRDLALATELARSTAQAVDNARLYREAQEAILARDRFLSIASHELRTPVTSIKGYTYLLRRRAENNGARKERDLRALRILDEEAERLNRLINQLLDVSRVNSSELSLRLTAVDLGALISRVARTLEPTLEKHTLEIRCATDGPVVVRGDELRLEQVIHNLLQNAVKYTPDGGPIIVTLVKEDRQARFAVTDQGIGIPADELPQLFDRFFRAVNVEMHRIDGMGLGLYIVRRVVEAHGGDVQVTSELNSGSTFTVNLPLIPQVDGLPDGEPAETAG
jgi:signal transduction histidine kinase